jgi:hypothetical protein
LLIRIRFKIQSGKKRFNVLTGAYKKIFKIIMLYVVKMWVAVNDATHIFMLIYDIIVNKNMEIAG